jgi:hypothetical protein
MMFGKMALETRLVVIDTHAIETDVRDGRLFAAEVTCKDGVASTVWIDVTDWSRAELFAWLGY